MDFISSTQIHNCSHNYLCYVWSMSNHILLCLTPVRIFWESKPNCKHYIYDFHPNLTSYQTPHVPSDCYPAASQNQMYIQATEHENIQYNSPVKFLPESDMSDFLAHGDHSSLQPHPAHISVRIKGNPLFSHFTFIAKYNPDVNSWLSENR